MVHAISVEKLEEIFPHVENILHCGVFLYDLETRQPYWSPGIFAVLDVEPYSIEISDDSFLRYVLPEDRERVKAAARASRENYSPYVIEFSILSGKGIYKRVHTENSIKKDLQGQPVEYSGVMKDITESYFYKRALEQKVMQLDKSNQNLQEFVYVASHDLQEPLRKISTFVERLQSKFEGVLGPEGNMYLKRIVNSGHNMQTLLEDLLSFSRLSFHDKQFETVSLKACLDSVLSDLEIKIEETKTTVAYSDLPEVQGYPSQIKQLFVNLIANAIKFKKTNEPPMVRIISDLVTDEAYPDWPLNKGVVYVRLVITDNGIGFESEFSERIFLIFQRLNAKAEYPGSGIGLSICKKIVDNHHGFIFAAGIPNKGATFTVLLPQTQS